jgi:hypothetical protein
MVVLVLALSISLDLMIIMQAVVVALLEQHLTHLALADLAWAVRAEMVVPAIMPQLTVAVVAEAVQILDPTGQPMDSVVAAVVAPFT